MTSKKEESLYIKIKKVIRDNDSCYSVDDKCIDIQNIIREHNKPTSESVCKALSEYFKEEVSYKDDERLFVFASGDRKGGCITGCNIYHNTYAISGYAIPPHLIILLGEFYQGLEE
jgi:hypothetical protein